MISFLIDTVLVTVCFFSELKLRLHSWQHFFLVIVFYLFIYSIVQARNQGGVHGVRTHPPQQAQKVRILILNIQVKECSRLNWSLKLNSDI